MLRNVRRRYPSRGNDFKKRKKKKKKIEEKKKEKKRSVASNNERKGRGEGERKGR